MRTCFQRRPGPVLESAATGRSGGDGQAARPSSRRRGPGEAPQRPGEGGRPHVSLPEEKEVRGRFGNRQKEEKLVYRLVEHVRTDLLSFFVCFRSSSDL